MADHLTPFAMNGLFPQACPMNLTPAPRHAWAINDLMIMIPPLNDDRCIVTSLIWSRLLS